MLHSQYVLLFMLLVAMVDAVGEMAEALDEIDWERFSLWMCVATVVALLAAYLIRLAPLF